MISVLFVCHGNICRSPISEFVMKDMVTKRGIKAKFYVCSHQYGGNLEWNRESGLSAGKAGIGKAWDFLRGEKSGTDHQSRLWKI